MRSGKEPASYWVDNCRGCQKEGSVAGGNDALKRRGYFMEGGGRTSEKKEQVKLV